MEQSGVTNSTIREGKKQTHETVDEVFGKLPEGLADLERGRFKDYDEPVSCGSPEDSSDDARGSTQWTYGFFIDLTRQMSSSELEDVLTPEGSDWKLTRSSDLVRESDGSVEGRRVIYDREHVRFTLELYGEQDHPTISFSGTTDCYNNGVSGISQ